MAENTENPAPVAENNNETSVNQKAESQQASSKLEFSIGDRVRVHVRIIEGDKERIQVFEGRVIKKKNGPHGSFTVRKVSFGIGVERIFPVDSPKIAALEVVGRAKIRRAKLYYLRKLSGKAARIAEVRK